MIVARRGTKVRIGIVNMVVVDLGLTVPPIEIWRVIRLNLQYFSPLTKLTLLGFLSALYFILSDKIGQKEKDTEFPKD